MYLDDIQAEVKEWCKHNFPNAQPWEPLLGIQEEVGELSHAFLKRHQGIRTEEPHTENIKDAVADIIVYLLDFCNHEHIQLGHALADTWAKVKKRDWKNDPVHANININPNKGFLSKEEWDFIYNKKLGHGVSMTNNPLPEHVKVSEYKFDKPKAFNPQTIEAEAWVKRKQMREAGIFPGDFQFVGHTPDAPPTVK